MQAELFSVPDASTPPGANESAVLALCDELDDSGLLVGKWAALATSLKTTAAALDRELRRPKVSVAAAQLMKMLQEGIEAMPEPKIESSDAYDTLSAVVETLTAQQLGGAA